MGRPARPGGSWKTSSVHRAFKNPASWGLNAERHTEDTRSVLKAPDARVDRSSLVREADGCVARPRNTASITSASLLAPSLASFAILRSTRASGASILRSDDDGIGLHGCQQKLRGLRRPPFMCSSTRSLSSTPNRYAPVARLGPGKSYPPPSVPFKAGVLALPFCDHGGRRPVRLASPPMPRLAGLCPTDPWLARIPRRARRCRGSRVVTPVSRFDRGEI